MRIDKFTVKAQEAIQAGQALARRPATPSTSPSTWPWRCSTRRRAWCRAVAPADRRRPAAASATGSRRRSASFPRCQGATRAYLCQRLLKLFDKAEDEAKALKDEYVSTEHLLLARQPRTRARPARSSRPPASPATACSPCSRRCAAAPGSPARRPRPVPGAGEVRPGPHRRGARRQARPGHRPRRGDPPRRSRCSPAAPRTTRC